MKAILVIFSLFLSSTLIVNAQELPNMDEPDSNFEAAFVYLFDAQREISSFRDDIQKLETSVSTDKPEDILSRGGISRLTSYTLMAQTAIINCKYFWSITFTWSNRPDFYDLAPTMLAIEMMIEINATENIAVCDGITYNLNLIDLCANLIKIEVEHATERDIIIKAHDIEQYLRNFTSEFKLLSDDYGAYVRHCAANAISKQKVKDSL